MRGETMVRDKLSMPPIAKAFTNAFAPFPRYTWIHPDVPTDELDRVCKIIWSRAKALPGRGRSSAQRPQRVCGLSGKDSGSRPEVQQNEMVVLGLITQCKEDNCQNDPNFTGPWSWSRSFHLGHRAEQQQRDGQHKKDKKKGRSDFSFPSPYHSVRRAEEQQKERDDLGLITQCDLPVHTHVTKAALVVSPAMALQLNENDAGGEQRIEEKSIEIGNSQSSRRDIDNTEDHTLTLPLKITRDICESEDELDTNGGSVSSLADDDVVAPPGVECTDSSDTDSFSDTNEVEENDIPHTSDDPRFDSEQYCSSNMERNFSQLSTNNAGILLRPREPSALDKVNGQWEIPLSDGTSAPMQAPVQDKASQTNPKTDTRPVWQQAYDLLADFPALQAPEKPFALDEFRHGTPKTKTAEVKGSLTDSPNHCQDSGVSHERRMENVPREVSSICLGDQKSVLKLQTFGLVSQHNSLTVNCEKMKANSQLPPRGTDGVDVNARSWATTAKAGMKQAAAPEEKARPYILQQVVINKRAKIGNSAAQRFSNKVTPQR